MNRKNRSRSAPKHYCPVCNKSLNNTLDKHVPCHKDVNGERLTAYAKAMFTKSLRGPVYLPDIINQIKAAGQDEEQLEKVLANVLNSQGVETTRKRSEAVLVHDMTQIFRKVSA